MNSDCLFVTTNTHINKHMKYRVLRTLALYGKVKLQSSNRFMMEYSVSKISQKGIFYVRLSNKTFAGNLIRTIQKVSLQRDRYNIIYIPIYVLVVTMLQQTSSASSKCIYFFKCI